MKTGAKIFQLDQMSRCRDAGSPDRIGGKAAALVELRRSGFRVPRFFVALPGAEGASIRAAFDADFGTGTRVACRSSAREEDSAGHSFAGQFESFLGIDREAVVDRVRAVWASGESERTRVYGNERGVAVTRPAALVQEMIEPVFAGVAFSVDPVSGRRRVAVVSAVRGLGDSLVSGEVDGETLEIDRDGSVRSRYGDKAVGLPEDLAVQVVELARQAADYFGCPQDIEWAIDAGGDLFLLQSRPITSLANVPDPDEARILWDNSNIAESYSGVTTPLTYSFARRAYEHVYREFCRLLWVPERRVAQSDGVFRAMIGLVRGRIYYNLVSWYRVLALLPGFRLNRGFMEQMMGVREPMPAEVVEAIEREQSVGRLRDALHLGRTLFGLLVRAVFLPRSIRRFRVRLDAALAATPAAVERLSPDELIAHYRDLESRLLRRWDAPLVNDFFAMIACGVLRRMAKQWMGDESLANAGLRDIGDIISLEPARRIRLMAERRGRGESIESDLADYVERFGDRCVEELKLESPTLSDDATSLRHSIESLADRLNRGEIAADAEKGEEEDRLGAALAKLNPIRRLTFRWMLGVARRRVRDRENLRFERTRLFGRVRRIMRGLGERLVETGRLETRDDVFFCELEELLGTFDGTAAGPVTTEVIAARTIEFAGYRQTPAPPDRFETVGPPLAPGAIRETEGKSAEISDAASGGDCFRGIGACAGRVRGPVRVVRDPRGVSLEPGEILVARQTDPGWVVLFPAASGLLVERGSLLSHSAIVAREMGIPAIVSLRGITDQLADGDWVEMDGATGEVIRVGQDTKRATSDAA